MHRQVVKEKYEREGAICGLHQPLEFESDLIILNIPLNGITVKGWNITPLMRPVVRFMNITSINDDSYAVDQVHL